MADAPSDFSDSCGSCILTMGQKHWPREATQGMHGTITR